MRLNLNKNLFSFLVRGARLVLFSVVGLILFTVTAYAAKNTVFSDRKIDTLEEAAEKILKIELVKTPGERMAFEKGWKEIKEDPGFSTDLGKKYLFNNTGGYRFQPDTAILKVRNEIIYGRDLNYYMFLVKFDTYTSGDDIPLEELADAVRILISYSIVLQEGNDQNMIDLAEETFDVYDKNYTRRNERVSNVYERVANNYVRNIEGEVIFSWFKNNVVPISEEYGRTVSKKKMEAIHTDLLNGRITMEDAGTKIANDKELLKDVDPAAFGNAYHSFKKQLDDELFTVDDLDHKLWKMQEGEISEILVGRDALDKNHPEDKTDIFHTIIKVNKKNEGRGYLEGDGYESTIEFMKSIAQESLKYGESIILL